jgi:site-specific recombinase XerD
MGDKKNEMHFYVLLRDFLTEYLVGRRNFSEKTATSYRQTMNIFRRYSKEEKGINFDKLDFTYFSRGSVYDFLMWLKNAKKNSAQTLNLRLSAIKSFLKYCGEEDIQLMTAYLDVATIHAFKAEKKPCVEYLTQQQLKLLFAMPDVTAKLGRRDRFFLIFAYETGARMQELLDLRLANIVRNEAGTRVKLHGKGNKTRHVPLLGDTAKHTDAYLAEFHKDSPKDAFLFFTVHNGQHTQMTPGTVDHFMKKYGRQANLRDSNFPEGLHVHMLRHSIAMAMHKKGIPISYIKDFLGHTSIETTSVYSYADDETIVKALESLDHDDSGVSRGQKNWKGKEQYLLDFCGLN